MSETITPEMETQEEILEGARGYREGLEWFEEERTSRASRGLSELESAASPSAISDKAFEMIVFFEVTSKEVYTRKYQSPIWPQAESGVTIGIGYDVGYASRQQLRDDWTGAIPDSMIAKLERALGVKGRPAKTLAAELRADVTVPWDAALPVHRSHVLPRWVDVVERHLPNCAQLSEHCLGALTSLTYNRGASFAKREERYREMRAIKQHMTDRQFARIPGELRAMKRLWPDLPGLLIRRDKEAALFEEGLRVTEV